MLVSLIDAELDMPISLPRLVQIGAYLRAGVCARTVTVEQAGQRYRLVKGQEVFLAAKAEGIHEITVRIRKKRNAG